MLQALDVLACNSDIHIPDIDTRFLRCFLDGILDRLYRIFDVGNNTSFDSDRRNLAMAKDFDLPKFIFTSDDDRNLRRANI